MNASPEKSTALPAIATAGLIVGILDITSAFIIWFCRGVPLTRGLQGIATGLLGPQSYENGLATAGLGLAIHFFIAFVVVTVFYVASRKLWFLVQHPLVSGPLYGVLVYIFMYWFVLPHTFPKFRHAMFNDVLAVIIHISLIGFPTAVIVSRYSQRPTERQQ